MTVVEPVGAVYKTKRAKRKLGEDRQGLFLAVENHP